MSIFLNKDSKVIVQGMTGWRGHQAHRRCMLESGTDVVGGVNARKAGTDGRVRRRRELPVFGTVAEAMEETGADVVGRLRPAGLHQGRRRRGDRRRHRRCVVVITEGVAGAGHRRVLRLRQGARARPGSSARTAPASSPPASRHAGIIPANISGKGPVGLVSKSGTLTYQMMYELRDFGFSTAIGIGGDPIIGTTHIDALEAFENDPETKAIVMIGEIGGDAEERAAAYIKDHVTKPVVGYVAGFTAPEGKTMGHAGAIVSGSVGHRRRPRRRPSRPPASRSARRRPRPPT